MLDANCSQCSPDNPCLRCPASSPSCKEKSWPAVGCNRGSFEEVLAPLYLCPNQDLKHTASSETSNAIALLPPMMPTSVNAVYRTHLDTRTEFLQRMLDTSAGIEATTLISYLRTLFAGIHAWRFREFELSSLLSVPSSLRVAFTPLEECIAAVIYEAIECDWGHLEGIGEFPQILTQTVALLHSAARYQAKIDSVGLSNLFFRRIALEKLISILG
jgi:hypothetical protein